MNAARIDALIASSWNLHVGVQGDEPMTPSRAATLEASDRKALVLTLLRQGGCDIYNADDCREALSQMS